MDAHAQLDQFISRYLPSVAADGRNALAHLQCRLPTATRLVYDNYNALVVAFAASEKPGDILLSIAFYPRYVTLFFLRGAILPDPQGLLEGSGSTVRSIRLEPVSRLAEPAVAALIDHAVAAAPPLPAGGEGLLVIKSVSKNQRPRRPKG